MTALSPALDAALAGPNPVVFGAVEIVLKSHTIRIMPHSGIVIFDGKTFTGRDATYGILFSIEDLTDGVGGQAPSLRMTLIPESTEAAVDLASAADQGSKVTVWLGAVEPSNGLVIGEPLLVFLGQLDVPILKTMANGYQLELQVVSAFEAFLLTDSGVALSDAFHRRMWPGETGLSEVTTVLHRKYWGSIPASGVSQ